MTRWKWSVVGLTVLGFVITIAWFGFLEPPFLTYTGLPLKALNSPFPGEVVVLQVDRCSTAKNRRSYVITEELVSDEFEPGRMRTGGVMTPAQLVSVKAGCTSIPSQLHRVPADARPGSYHWEGIAEVPGTWRTVEVPYRSESFLVRSPAQPKE